MGSTTRTSIIDNSIADNMVSSELLEEKNETTVQTTAQRGEKGKQQDGLGLQDKEADFVRQRPSRSRSCDERNLALLQRTNQSRRGSAGNYSQRREGKQQENHALQDETDFVPQRPSRSRSYDENNNLALLQRTYQSRRGSTGGAARSCDENNIALLPTRRGSTGGAPGVRNDRAGHSVRASEQDRRSSDRKGDSSVSNEQKRRYGTPASSTKKEEPPSNDHSFESQNDRKGQARTNDDVTVAKRKNRREDRVKEGHHRGSSSQRKSSRDSAAARQMSKVSVDKLKSRNLTFYHSFHESLSFIDLGNDDDDDIRRPISRSYSTDATERRDIKEIEQFRRMNKSCIIGAERQNGNRLRRARSSSMGLGIDSSHKLQRVTSRRVVSEEGFKKPARQQQRVTNATKAVSREESIRAMTVKNRPCRSDPLQKAKSVRGAVTNGENHNRPDRLQRVKSTKAVREKNDPKRSNRLQRTKSSEARMMSETKGSTLLQCAKSASAAASGDRNWKRRMSSRSPNCQSSNSSRSPIREQRQNQVKDGTKRTESGPNNIIQEDTNMANHSASEVSGKTDCIGIERKHASPSSSVSKPKRSNLSRVKSRRTSPSSVNQIESKEEGTNGGTVSSSSCDQTTGIGENSSTGKTKEDTNDKIKVNKTKGESTKSSPNVGTSDCVETNTSTSIQMDLADVCTSKKEAHNSSRLSLVKERNHDYAESVHPRSSSKMGQKMNKSFQQMLKREGMSKNNNSSSMLSNYLHKITDFKTCKAPPMELLSETSSTSTPNSISGTCCNSIRQEDDEYDNYYDDTTCCSSKLEDYERSEAFGAENSVCSGVSVCSTVLTK